MTDKQLRERLPILEDTVKVLERLLDEAHSRRVEEDNTVYVLENLFAAASLEMEGARSLLSKEPAAK